MADEKIIIQIEADSKSVDKALGNLEKKSQSIGDGIEAGFKNVFGKSAADVAQFATQFGLVAGAVGVGAKAVKEFGEALFNAALEGEKIGVINNQFKLLSEQAGLSADAISSGLIAAADGLADTEDILEAASKGIVAFGANAERLPEVFELARKASQVFGGDVVSRFEQLNQAIASGQTRALKNLGIVLDQQKINEDYAKSLGVTANSLNETQRQQALLNAVLERGKDAFSGVDVNANALSQSSTRLSVAIGELKDTVSILAKDTFGNFFQTSLTNAANSINDFNLQLKNATGNATIEEQVELLKKRNAEINNSIELAKQVGGNAGLIQVLEFENKKIQEQLSLINERNDAQNENAFQRALKAPTTESGPSITDEQRDIALANSLKAETQFAQQLLAIKQQSFSDQTAIANGLLNEELRIEELKRLQQEQIAIENEQNRINENLLKIQDLESDLLTDQQYNQLKEAEQSRHAAALEKIKQDNANKLNEIQKKQTIDLNKSLASSLASQTQQFTQNIIKGENLFKAFGSAILNIVGDMAIQLGTFYILNGIAVEALQAVSGTGSIAAGAALIALGTILKSFSIGGGASAQPSGGASSQPSISESEDNLAVEQVEEKTTKVQIDVAGTVLNPIQVGQQIAQILNETFDATGTRVVTGAA